MRDLIEQFYNIRVLEWDEPTDFGPRFVVIQAGCMIVADSLALLISELQAATHQPMMLAA